MNDAERVDASELLPDAARYLEMAKAGRRIPVTDHGEVVAYLVPAGQGGSTFERLVAAGKVRLATGNLLDHLPPPPAPPGTRPLSEVLLEMRDEEDY